MLFPLRAHYAHGLIFTRKSGCPCLPLKAASRHPRNSRAGAQNSVLTYFVEFCHNRIPIMYLPNLNDLNGKGMHMATLHKDGTVSFCAQDGSMVRTALIPAAGEGRRLWSCRLPVSTIEAIKAIAEREGISQAQVVIRAMGNMSSPNSNYVITELSRRCSWHPRNSVLTYFR